MKAIVLLSGGIDSATVLYRALNQGYMVSCLIFDYGQRHRREIESAIAIADGVTCDWKLLSLEFPWKGSALLDTSAPLSSRDTACVPHDIPSTYVPARNTIFLSYALSFAEAADADAIFIGVNAVDYSGYPDCRPEYIEAMNTVIQTGTRRGTEGKAIQLCAPLLHMNKRDIVRQGVELGVPYNLCWSCYRGGATPCMECDACRLRRKGFEDAGFADPGK